MNGELALWDFNSFSGTTFIGELQTAPLYPVAILFAPFIKQGSPFSVDLFLVFHFGLAAFFMYECLRSFQLSKSSSFIGALAFSFVGSVALRVIQQPNLFCGLVYLPAVLYCAKKALSCSKEWCAAYIGLGGISLALSLLAGHVHSFIQAALCLFLVGAVHAIAKLSSPTRSVIVCLGTSIIATAITLPQLFATNEYLKVAYKFCAAGYTKYPHVVPYEELAKNALSPHMLLSVLNLPGAMFPPDGGTLFITYTGCFLLAVSLTQPRRFSVWVGLTITITALVLGFSGSNILGWIVYHTPILNMVREPSRALHLYALGVAFLIASGVDVFLLSGHLQKFKTALVGGLIACMLFECASFVHVFVAPRSLPGSAYNYMNNSAIDYVVRKTKDKEFQCRYSLYNNQGLPPNSCLINGTLSTLGYRATVYGPYLDYISTASPDSEVFDLLSANILVSKNDIDALKNPTVVNGLFIYERSTSYPIFWLLDSNDVRHREAIGKASWHENSVELALFKNISGHVVFSQLMFPDWQVFVDGKQRKLEPYDGHFQSVSINNGDKRVEFSYRPSWLPPTFFVAFLALLGCFGSFAFPFHQGNQSLLKLQSTSTN
jgi:hypothetical protein